MQPDGHCGRQKMDSEEGERDWVRPWRRRPASPEQDWHRRPASAEPSWPLRVASPSSSEERERVWGRPWGRRPGNISAFSEGEISAPSEDEIWSPRENERLSEEVDRLKIEVDRLKIDLEACERHRQCGEVEASKTFIDFEPSVIDAMINDQELYAKGGSGYVYKAELGGRDVAIKVPKDLCVEDEKLAFAKEVQILGRIRHPNIVVLYGACVEKCALVYEFLPKGTLQARLSEKGRHAFSWKKRIHVAGNISTALVYLHDSRPYPVTHGDLKPANILFGAEDVCKLGDFGISRFLQHNTTGGTPCHITEISKGSGPYKDPCFDKSKRLTGEADVFAFGIILLQLVTGAKDATGLRKFVSDGMKKLKGGKQDTKLGLLGELGLIDETWNSNDKTRKVALKMLKLGLRCSERRRKNRPDFKREVWAKINEYITREEEEEVPALRGSSRHHRQINSITREEEVGPSRRRRQINSIAYHREEDARHSPARTIFYPVIRPRGGYPH